jgi:hypothetical protein
VEPLSAMPPDRQLFAMPQWDRRAAGYGTIFAVPEIRNLAMLDSPAT